MPDGSSRTGTSGEPSAVAATLTELSPGQERLVSGPNAYHIKYLIVKSIFAVYLPFNSSVLPLLMVTL